MIEMDKKDSFIVADEFTKAAYELIATLHNQGKSEIHAIKTEELLILDQDETYFERK